MTDDTAATPQQPLPPHSEQTTVAFTATTTAIHTIDEDHGVAVAVTGDAVTEEDCDVSKTVQEETANWVTISKDEDGEDDGFGFQNNAISGDWELTWPIWHMLPRGDRRALAQQHGYKTIGEFEEYMSMQQAVGDTMTVDIDTTAASDTANRNHSNNSNGTNHPGRSKKRVAVSGSSLATPYNNQMLYPEYQEGDAKTPAVVLDDEYDSEDDDNEEDKRFNAKLEETERLQQNNSTSTNQGGTISIDELMLRGGAILMLPDDLLHKVFAWLPVDAYATLALVSPHWQSFTRTEAVYKRLCERLYLNQSHRRALHVSRFGHSYRTMLEERPRVRAGGGVYVLKYARVKKIQRDMWTEIPVGAVLETVYYRYLYFQEDGRVVYALTSTPPHLMFPRLLRLCLNRTRGYVDPAAVWGTYSVRKTGVTVQARQEWQHVRLQLTIQIVETNTHCGATASLSGRYGCLSMDEHVTSASGNFEPWTSPDRIEFDVPTEPFRFVKDRRL